MHNNFISRLHGEELQTLCVFQLHAQRTEQPAVIFSELVLNLVTSVSKCGIPKFQRIVTITICHCTQRKLVMLKLMNMQAVSVKPHCRDVWKLLY